MTAIACACGGIRRDGVCDRCGPVKKRTHARKTTDRGYGGDWQRLTARLKKQAEFALCRDCLAQDKTTAAQEFHHVQKVKDRPDLRLEESNLMPLCKACHDARSAKGE